MHIFKKTSRFFKRFILRYKQVLDLFSYIYQQGRDAKGRTSRGGRGKRRWGGWKRGKKMELDSTMNL